MVEATIASSEALLLLSPSMASAASVASAPGDGRRMGRRAALGCAVFTICALAAFASSATDGTGAALAALGSSATVATHSRASSCSTHGFDDALPENPKAKVFLDAMPRLARSNLGTHLARCASELPLLPVVTSNDAYRLGNAVERQGVGWIGARRLVLEENAGYEGSILYDFLMGENEDQRAFVGSVVAKKRRMASEDLETTASLHGDNNTIVIPLRLSDKVRFMVEDYPVINTAVVEYKKMHCPWCTDLVIMTLLVWGEDKNHMFAYNYDEYKQSLTVLHSIAKHAQSPEGGSLRVTIRSTLDADRDFVYSAYSPHLVLPMVTPSSWHQLLTYCNRAVFDPVRESAAIKFYDAIMAPKLKMPGRRARLRNAYAWLEREVPDDVLVNWFQLETQKRGLSEHKVTVTEMVRWSDWPSIVKPYEVGMGAYDGAVRSIARTREAELPPAEAIVQPNVRRRAFVLRRDGA